MNNNFTLQKTSVMLRTILIEDELHAQSLLTQILNSYCQSVDVIDVQRKIKPSIASINLNKPDLVFMDYHLLDGNCFEILDNLSFRGFKLIFTTAHKDYALDAFRYQALDYILKPYGPQDVVDAVDRVEELQNASRLFSDFEKLLQRNNEKKISISTQKEILRIEVDEIVRVQADGSYSVLHLKSGATSMVSKTLKEIELQLCFPNFFRCHSSHLINLDHVKSYRNEDGGFIVLSGENTVPLARRRKSEFIGLIS